MSKIVFSGIQPTGNLHLGNYLGAIKNWVAIQNSGKYDCYFCVVDYHSLTGTMTAKERREKIETVVVELLALGIDPEKSTFFVQSHVPEHTELGWVFNNITPLAELYRMTQFKDKSAHQEKNITSGLLTYPILQAADILLYKGQQVPVGQDQVQHIELTRDIARWFNKKYGEFFPETKPLLTTIPKVMSLLEPAKKMGKSLGQGHVIELAETPEQIESKLKKAVTATEGGAGSPGVQNLLLLLKEFGTTKMYTQFTQAEKDKSIRYGDLKNELAKNIADYFAEFRQVREKLLHNKKQIEKIMEGGAKQAKKVAEKTMEDVRLLIGIR
jgi:tryptophanyl-tRNA synthetase